MPDFFRAVFGLGAKTCVAGWARCRSRRPVDRYLKLPRSAITTRPATDRSGKKTAPIGRRLGLKEQIATFGTRAGLLHFVVVLLFSGGFLFNIYQCFFSVQPCRAGSPPH